MCQRDFYDKLVDPTSQGKSTGILGLNTLSLYTVKINSSLAEESVTEEGGCERVPAAGLHQLVHVHHVVLLQVLLVQDDLGGGLPGKLHVVIVVGAVIGDQLRHDTLVKNIVDTVGLLEEGAADAALPDEVAGQDIIALVDAAHTAAYIIVLVDAAHIAAYRAVLHRLCE